MTQGNKVFKGLAEWKSSSIDFLSLILNQRIHLIIHFLIALISKYIWFKALLRMNSIPPNVFKVVQPVKKSLQRKTRSSYWKHESTRNVIFQRYGSKLFFLFCLQFSFVWGGTCVSNLIVFCIGVKRSNVTSC